MSDAAVAPPVRAVGDADVLARPLLPALAGRCRRARAAASDGLELETFDGSAWIGVVPFHMTDVSPRGLPRVRRLADFAELNVRTYVTAGGKPGVWFFSLDATQPLAVRIGARLLPPRLRRRADRVAPQRRCRPLHERAHASRRAASRNSTCGTGRRGRRPGAEPGTLDYFLTARYCLYAATRRGQVLRQEIDHDPWPLQPAEAEVGAVHDDAAARDRPRRRAAAGALRGAAGRRRVAAAPRAVAVSPPTAGRPRTPAARAA